jgi:mRNA interferase YafQ
MRTIKYTTKFKRDYKREKRSGRHKDLDELIKSTTALLANNMPLPFHYYDHPLSGQWKDHRDCHIKPDLVLIYREPDDKTIQLVRLGSHSELSLA